MSVLGRPRDTWNRAPLVAALLGSAASTRPVHRSLTSGVGPNAAKRSSSGRLFWTFEVDGREASVEVGGLDQAREEMEATLLGGPRMAGARLHLGIDHHRAGNMDEAREPWERCRKDHPSDPGARGYLVSSGPLMTEEGA